MASCLRGSSDNILRSPVPDVFIPDVSLPEFIWRSVDGYADCPAMACGVSGRSYTYKEARVLSRRFGAALLKKGFQPGDVLAVMLPNMPEYPSIVLGALEAGLIVTTINSTCKKNEILHAVRATGAKIILALSSYVPLIKEVFEELKNVIPIIAVSFDELKVSGEKLYDFDDMISGNGEPELSGRAQADDVAFLILTSGTTGASKIVTWTHKNVVATFVIERVAAVKNVGDLSQPNSPATAKDQDIMLAALPSGVTFGLISTFAGLLGGVKVITLPTWEPRTFLDILSKQKPRTVELNCNPSMIYDLQLLAKTEDLKAVKGLMTAAGYVVPSHIENLLKKVPNSKDVTLINGYGTTETMLVCAAILDPLAFTPEKIGFLRSNTQVRIVSSSGTNLGPGEEGEIYVKGPLVTKGYFNNDEANADAFDGDGWYKTGDLGCYDENGTLYLKGRLKDTIKIGGRTISPVELEAVLLCHPSVAEAAVIGVPADERLREKPVAYVVPKPGAELDCDKVSEFVAESVAPHKQLSQIIVRDSLPRNSNGKIQKNVLKEEYLKSI